MSVRINNLNPILQKDPNKIYNSYLSRARILKVASIINLIGICIFSTALLLSIGVSVQTLPLIQLAIGISIPFLGVFYSLMKTASKNNFKIAKFYKQVAQELKLLKTQTDSDVNKYLRSIKCRNIQDIRLVLPAIAHYKAWIKTKDTALEEIEKMQKTETKDDKLKYKLQKLCHHIYEKEVLKAKLKAAEMFHVINNPNDKKTLLSYGKIFIQSFSKRMASFMRGDDSYFVFYDKIKDQKKRSGLTFTDVDEMRIEDISKLIFES